MEKKISKIYKEKSKHIADELSEYLSQFKDEDKHKQELVNSGELSVHEYKAWKISIINSRKCKKITQKIARNFTQINQDALKYVNGEMSDIFIDAYKYSAKDIEEQVNDL